MTYNAMKLFKLNSYKIGVLLASSSMAFGILREFLILGLLGLSANNDHLQLYLSIFYTIGLTIDAMRLACLNLCTVLSLSSMLLCATIIGFPFACLIGLAMNYSAGGLDWLLLCITIAGSFLNLIAALLITFKQRHHHYLAAQFINVLPNLILIPGILACYLVANAHLIVSIVCLTSFIPVVQCVLLLLLPKKDSELLQTNQLTLTAGVMTFARHFSSMISEQLYQIIIRSAFYRFGTGFLSIFSFAIRIYAAARFVLVDSFIGSKLANWQIPAEQHNNDLTRLRQTSFNLFLVLLTLFLSLQGNTKIVYFTLQMSCLLLVGFYFSTVMRILYFKINRHHNHPALVRRYGFFELMFLLLALVQTQQDHYSILTLLWIGFIAKPFAQLIMMTKHYRGLTLQYEVSS